MRSAEHDRDSGPDPPELEYLASAPIRQATLEQLGAALPAGPLYVHVDADISDPAQLPELRYPAPGGPRPAEVTGVLGGLLGTRRVTAVGIASIWHPGTAREHASAPTYRPHSTGDPMPNDPGGRIRWPLPPRR